MGDKGADWARNVGNVVLKQFPRTTNNRNVEGSMNQVRYVNNITGETRNVPSEGEWTRYVAKANN